MNTLIALGTGTAYIYSAWVVGGGGMEVYFEAAAVITMLVLLGEVLQLRARSRTSDAIRSLLQLAPNTAARIAHDGSEQEVPLEQVHIGDRLRVRPGGKVPVDGVGLLERHRVRGLIITPALDRIETA